jgi:DNA-binding transcriptional regulator YiaG
MNDTAELIDITLTRLKSIPGATKKFYDVFPELRGTVHHWRKGRAKPSPEQFALFLKTSVNIIREFEPEFKDIKSKTEVARNELLNLLNA